MAPSPNLNLHKYRVSNSRGGTRAQPGASPNMVNSQRCKNFIQSSDRKSPDCNSLNHSNQFSNSQMNSSGNTGAISSSVNNSGSKKKPSQFRNMNTLISHHQPSIHFQPQQQHTPLKNTSSRLSNSNYKPPMNSSINASSSKLNMLELRKRTSSNESNKKGANKSSSSKQLINIASPILQQKRQQQQQMQNNL